jgi:thioredoxin 1
MALQLSKVNFEVEVLQSEKPVLVDFWATWCGPCQMVLPIIEELAEDSSVATKCKIAKVNVDEQMELARRYKVMTIPTLAIFKDGEIVHKEIGAKNKEELLEMINTYAK